MKHDIKFYANQKDDMHCTHAVFRSLFHYFFGEELTWHELDSMTKTIPGKAPWTMPAEIELAKRGIKIINIEPFDYEEFYTHGKAYLSKTFGKETVDYYRNKSNLFHVKDLIPEFLKYVKHETRKARVSDIDFLLEGGYLIGAEINSRILNKRPGFSLHYVLVKEKNDNGYIINDPGLPPIEDRQVTQEEFLEALGKEGTNGEVTAFKKMTRV